MNTAMKNQIIQELDSLPDQKGYTLLDFVHFLKQEQKGNSPNAETNEAINEVENDKGELKTYNSASELFEDLAIEI
ncbi:MAG: hypothetical protein PF447_05485 [Spirochaetaceae bacterium]|jgi:hypothetical protein|nr:hypothetical protein [Spirochaetaceae bacterium]